VESTQPVVQLKEVSYIYPEARQPALLDISLEIHEGEVLGVVGATGAGKSTFCQLLQGLVPNFYGGRFFGYATICGLDTVDGPISDLAGCVASVFQDPQSQILTTSVENEVAFGLENLGIPREEMLGRIAQALAMVGLAGLNKKHPQELSGGQQQRLALAAALAMRPKLLVLDEPTAQLDPVGSEMIFSNLQTVRKEFGTVIVIASHAAEEVAECVDRIIVLSEGQMVRMGTPAEILSACSFLSQHHIRPPQVAETFWYLKELEAFSSDVPTKLNDGYSALDSLPDPATPIEAGEPSDESSGNRDILVQFDSVRFTYPDSTEALRGVSFEIYSGEYLVIAGHNGAGKSTVCRLLLNLIKPTGGSISLKGGHPDAVSSFIGYVPQNPDVALFCATVRDEVALALKFRGMEGSEIESRVAASLAPLGLQDKAHAHPLSLSKGERARVVIAAVLATEPDILVFDEPTTGQDLEGARQILDVTRQLNAAGKTIIVVTHHLHFISEYGQRLLLLGRGTVLGQGSLPVMYQQIDLLRSTSVMPPQTALLVHHWSQRTGQTLSALTPHQLAIQLASSFTSPHHC
jgi:energy-coupling factor transporter ATP-binding protein EcfA2